MKLIHKNHLKFLAVGYCFDASELPLGRLATEIAKHLTGKYKPTYTPHIDGGDYVVVINAAQTVVTGYKETDKYYYRHSGFPGGIKETQFKEMRERHPERIIEEAVKGMLSKEQIASRAPKAPTHFCWQRPRSYSTNTRES